MAEIWRTRDRLGRVVVFTEAGRDHIRQRRDDVAELLDELRAVIERPDIVTLDRRYAHRESFYRRTPFKPGWIKVVVRYRPAQPQGTWAGEVITAYPVKRPHPKEVPLWP